MRSTLLAFTLLAHLSSLARADDAAAVVNKAVQAMATSDLRLNRLANMIRTEHGSFFVPGDAITAKHDSFVATRAIEIRRRAYGRQPASKHGSVSERRQWLA